MVLNGAVDGLTDFYLEAGLLEERLLHDDDIVLLLSALQGHGCVVEELLDFFLLQMAAEHGIAGRQIEVGMRVIQGACMRASISSWILEKSCFFVVIRRKRPAAA